MIVHDSNPINAESPRAALAETDITDVDSFYVRNHGPVPAATAEWRVLVDGLVDEQLSLTLGDLQTAFPSREIIATLQCAGNRRAGLMAVREIPGEAPWGPGATGTARWHGVRLRDVLQRAGIAEEAEHVELTGADVSAEASPAQPFAASIPRHKALAAEVLLAWEMNGAPLPAVHGAPLRAVVPGYVGARSVKWLTRIRALRHPSESFFQSRAYRLLTPEADPGAAEEGMALGAIAVNSEILEPQDGATVGAGQVSLTGYAFAGDDRTIARVDVSADAGASWSQAELLDQLSPWSARRWRTQLELAPGEWELVARAWDSAAATQPEDPAGLWNPKGYVNNAWSRIRLRTV